MRNVLKMLKTINNWLKVKGVRDAIKWHQIGKIVKIFYF
jgi:hypothetical protein